jgi:hypothetical protein
MEEGRATRLGKETSPYFESLPRRQPSQREAPASAQDWVVVACPELQSTTSASSRVLLLHRLPSRIPPSSRRLEDGIRI